MFWKDPRIWIFLKRRWATEINLHSCNEQLTYRQGRFVCDLCFLLWTLSFRLALQSDLLHEIDGHRAEFLRLLSRRSPGIGRLIVRAQWHPSVQWWKQIVKVTLGNLTLTSKPRAKALTKSAPFCRDPISLVSLDVCTSWPFISINNKGKSHTLISTHLLCTFIRIWSPKISVNGPKTFNQSFLRGVIRWGGIGIRRVSDFNVVLSAPVATLAKTGAVRFCGSNEASKLIMGGSSSSMFFSISASWDVNASSASGMVSLSWEEEGSDLEVCGFLRVNLRRFLFFLSARDEGPFSISIGACVTTMTRRRLEAQGKKTFFRDFTRSRHSWKGHRNHIATRWNDTLHLCKEMRNLKRRQGNESNECDGYNRGGTRPKGV